MKKTFLFLMVVCLFATATTSSYAALYFKMTAEKTALTVGETATIEVFAYSEEAAGLNGLNGWQLSMFVSGGGGGGGVVEVVPGSITLFAPFSFDSLVYSVNSPSGAITDLSLNSLTPSVDSDLGVGDYDKIAEFSIQGISAGEVIYAIGDSGLGFFGSLRDFPIPGNYFDGTFDTAASDTQFTIIPEPATLALLGSGISFLCLRSRKSGRL